MNVCDDCGLSEFECECVVCYYCDGDHEDGGTRSVPHLYDCPNRPDGEEEEEN